MKPLASAGGFLWAFVLVLLAFVGTGNSFKQELWLYDDAQDNGLHFQSHVSDTSHFTSFLPFVTRACTSGVWDFFRDVNETFSTTRGSYISSGVVCYNLTTAAFVKSLRHEGASDTNTDALSLYDGSSAVSGNEIFVTARAYTGITNKIFDIAITGTSDWMLFEGQALDGKSACYKVPSGYFLQWNTVSSLNLTTVGSVFKGCDLQKIENYRMLQAP